MSTAMPRFSVGDTAIVFLGKNEASPYLEVLGQRHGKYDVVNGRVTRGVLEGLTLEEAVACLQILADERSPARLGALSDLVCLGEVVSKSVAFEDSSGEAVTLTKLSVRDVLRGEISVGEFTVVKKGDYTDPARRQWDWDIPMLDIGKQYFLFLRRAAGGAYEIVGAYGGSYRVENGTVWRLDCPIARLRAEVQGE